MTNAPDSAETLPPKISLRDRLRAWWEGYDLSALQGKAKEEPDEGPASGPSGAPIAGAASKPSGTSGRLNRFGKPLWTATRMQVAEKMWGEGLVSPGGREYTESLVKPLGLNKAMSVLDLSAGLGGLTRTMHRAYGAWVTGLEMNPDLAEMGMEYSRRARLEKQASIEHYDPNELAINRRFDVVFAKEIFFTVADKDLLFRRVRELTKPGGQLLFIDYVLEQPDAARGLKLWADTEPMEPFPWSIDQTKRGIEQLGYDLRIAEDVTQRQLGFIATALGVLEQHLMTHSLDLETRQAVTAEVDLWAKRADALMRGLKLYRFHALLPG